jgi:putative membrane protein
MEPGGRYTGGMRSREPYVLVAVLAVVYIMSGWNPSDRATWWMEVAPVFAVLPVILVLEQRIGFTSLTLRLLAFEAVLVAVGAHYTYAHVPIGFWVSDLLGLERNHYDRFGHFMQGVVPALAMRELLLRTSPLRRGAWLFTIVSSICLAISALYEFIEWGAAVAFGNGATEFLGTQGDPWDSQWDMFLALIGSILAQLMLSGVHDRQMRAMGKEKG